MCDCIFLIIANGHVVKEEVSDGQTTYTTTYTRDIYDRPTAVIDPRGNVTAMEYDWQGNVTKITDALGNISTSEYDLLGRKIGDTNAEGQTTHYEYDAAGRMVKTLSPFDNTGDAEVKYYYDANGNITWRRTKTEENEYSAVEYRYNSADKLLAEIGKNGVKDSVIQYTYDSAGRISNRITGNNVYVNTPKGSVTVYSYDSNGRLAAVMDAMYSVETYQYDSYGNLIRKMDRNGTVTNSVYNHYGIISENAGGETITYSYDNLGRLEQKSFAGDSIAYEYDAFGRIVRETSGTRTRNYTYDANSNLTRFELKNGTVTEQTIDYTYDANNRLTNMTSNGTLFTYTYDVMGRLIAKNAGGNVTNYSYNYAGAITELENLSDGNTITEYTYEYSYDGNKISETDMNGLGKEYRYDTLGRLTYEYYYVNGEKKQTTAYYYDYGGNRTRKRVIGGDNPQSILYTYDANNRLTRSVCSYTNGGSETTDYTYDYNGNMLSEDTKQYEYDNRNRLKKAVTVNGISEYAYNADGLRKSKTVKGRTTEFVWNGMNMISEITEDGTKNYTYDITGIAMSEINSTNRYYMKNAHGDVTAVVGDEETSRLSYDAFGNRTQSNNVPANALKYQPYVKAAEELQIKQLPDNEEAKKLTATPEPVVPEGEIRQKEAAVTETEYVAAEPGKVYLSDMVWKSMTNGWGPAERDMNNKEYAANDGDTLTINGVQYEKGIGCHTISEIEIEINEEYETFETVVGVDDYTSRYGGKVKFKVYGDGELLEETPYLTGADDGMAIETDVSNVNLLKIVATNDGVNNNNNHADWADAKLTPKPFEYDDIDPFGYCGEYYDAELDMVYLRNRYYSPQIGRFITEDPIKDGLNWYAYCGNNPLMFVDPSGLLPTMLRYAIEKVNGSISYDETTGTATVTFNGRTAEYSGEVINGRMIVDSADIARDLNISETYILHNANDEFYSADDAAMAFGLVYNISSTLPGGVEVQSYIYENSNGTYSYADIAIGVELGDGVRTVYAPDPDANRTLAAWAHTHGPYNGFEDNYLNLFTGRIEYYDDDGNLTRIIGDGAYSYSLNSGGYVFTPGGHFKYLNYTQWEEKVTRWIQDSDPSVRAISTSFPVSR